jgi:hypothetical protein
MRSSEGLDLNTDLVLLTNLEERHGIITQRMDRASLRLRRDLVENGVHLLIRPRPGLFGLIGPRRCRAMRTIRTKSAKILMVYSPRLLAAVEQDL